MSKKSLAADAKAADAADDKAAAAEAAAKAAAVKVPYAGMRHGTGAASDERADVNKHGKWSGYGAAPVYALPYGSPPREYELPKAEPAKTK